MLLANIFSWDNPNLYLVFILSLINGVVLCLCSYKFLQIVQLSGYKNKPYFSWIADTKSKNISKLAMLSFLSLACLIITNVLFNAFQSDNILGYIGLIFYFYFCGVYINNQYKAKQKTPLRHTKRMIRLEIVLALVYAILTFCLTSLMIIATNYLRLISFPLLVIAIPIVVPFVNIIMYPLEQMVNNHYIKKAKRVLNENDKLIKIGITGSYGKTTTKNFLSDILSTKYSVCKTPSSYNTPMGLTKVILKQLSNENQIFIAEFGAKEVGDIAFLTKMIDPKFVAITSVGLQHLDTFKSFDNIMNTKNEIITHSSKDTICVFNTNCENTSKLFDLCDKEKYSSKIEDDESFVSAYNIKYGENGTEFELRIGQERKVVSAKILGKYNLDNLLTAIVIANKIGMSFDDIVESLKNIKPVAHRLELKKLDSGMLVIDDSFNANIRGSRQALEVLSMFKDRRKIVTTPGLVELGEKENEENYEFGKAIAQVADVCIIVNKNQAENIKKGLVDAGFNENNIIEAENLFLAQDLFVKILRSDDIMLIENDLPDSYI